jgi:hypothetical protein
MAPAASAGFEHRAGGLRLPLHRRRTGFFGVSYSDDRDEMAANLSYSSAEIEKQQLRRNGAYRGHQT